MINTKQSTINFPEGLAFSQPATTTGKLDLVPAFQANVAVSRWAYPTDLPPVMEWEDFTRDNLASLQMWADYYEKMLDTRIPGVSPELVKAQRESLKTIYTLILEWRGCLEAIWLS